MMNNEDIKIYVVMHKKFNLKGLKLPAIYENILVGNNDKCVVTDSTGDNISYKNKNYCELTALYWIWKNSKSRIVGLCHYRRFFLAPFYYRPFNENEILKVLNNYDIIVPNKYPVITDNIYNDYKEKHISSDLDICREIIKKKYPDYLSSFDEFMMCDYYSPYNMFICKKELIDNYCVWLFDILFELEKRIDLSERDNYQKRVFGFLAERLFNVWIRKNNLRKFNSFILCTEDPLKYRLKIRFKQKFKKIN